MEIWENFGRENSSTNVGCVFAAGLCSQHRAVGERHKQREREREERKEAWTTVWSASPQEEIQLSPHRECKASSAGVCVCILRGMGALQIHNVWGRELVPLRSLPSQMAVLLTTPLPYPTSPPSRFQGKFILSLAHCGEWRDWLAKGWPRVSWRTLPGQRCWS